MTAQPPGRPGGPGDPGGGTHASPATRAPVGLRVRHRPPGTVTTPAWTPTRTATRHGREG